MKKLLLVSAAVVALVPSVSFAAFDAVNMTACPGTGCALALNTVISEATTQTEIRSIVDFAMAANLPAEELAAVFAAALAVVPVNSPVAIYIREQVALLNLTLPAVASAADPITAS